MKTIWRHEVPIDDQEHTIVSGEISWTIAMVQTGPVDAYIEFWAEEKPGSPFYIARKFRVFGTGQQIPDNATYVATAPRVNGLVFHLYEMM